MNAVRPPLSPADLLYLAETEILKTIADHLADGNVASADWKIDRLRRLGALNERVAAIIGRYRTAVQDGMVSEVEVSAMEALLKSDETFARAREAGATLLDVLPADADPSIRNVITAWQNSSRSQMNLAMAAMLQNSGQVYVDTINRATLQVLTGTMSRREALVRAVREWSETGVPSITDKAGRQWSTEAYTSMVLRTNVRRVATEVQGVRAQQYGADLVEISAHAGARPLCAPYQGRIFSRSGSSEKYPPLSETSIGEPAGLFGINCGHNQYPFFEGISRQTYAPDDTPEKVAENERVYEESQRQRKLERSIRQAKREVQVMEALNDPQAVADAKGRVRDRQATLRSFIDDTGRTRRRDREQIYDKAPGLRTESGLSGPPSTPPPSRREFTPASSRREAEQWARDNLGVRLADYGKSDLSVINEWNKGALDALETFPKLRESFKDIGTNQALRRAFVERFTQQALGDPDLMARLAKFPEEKRIAMIKKAAEARAGRTRPNNWATSWGDPFRQGVSINEKVAKNPELLKVQLARDVASGFHPVGCDTVKSIIDHEMAHQVDAKLGWVSRSREFEELIAGHDVSRELSQYATKNRQEVIAEAWAEYRNNPTPRPLCVKIGQFLERQYFVKYGGGK